MLSPELVAHLEDGSSPCRASMPDPAPSPIPSEVDEALRFDDRVDRIWADLRHRSSWPAAFDRMLHGMEILRRQMTPEGWASSKVRWVEGHRLRERVRECPFTRRCQDQPRGYRPDPVALEAFYEGPEAAPTPLGDALVGFWNRSPLARAFRHRRALLARALDRAAAPGRARVLCLGAGHLPEVRWSRAAADDRLDFVAVDSDKQALECLLRNQPVGRLRLVQADALGFRDDGEAYDFIYVSNALDGLTDRQVRTVARRLHRMLRPRGRLMLSGFLESNPNRAAMELYQDWTPRHRTIAQMSGWVAALPGIQKARVDVRSDPDQVFGFVTVEVGAQEPIFASPAFRI